MHIGATSWCASPTLTHIHSRSNHNPNPNPGVCDIPLVVLLRALGLGRDEIATKICWGDNDLSELITPSMEHASVLLGDEIRMDDALDWIAKRYVSDKKALIRSDRIRAVQTLLSGILPHVHVNDPDAELGQVKALFIGYMARQLLTTATGQRAVTDLDHLGIKRLDGSGPLLERLFRDLFKRQMKEAKALCEKKLAGDRDIILSAVISSNMMTCEM